MCNEAVVDDGMPVRNAPSCTSEQVYCTELIGVEVYGGFTP